MLKIIKNVNCGHIVHDLQAKLTEIECINGVLELFMEGHLERWQRLSPENTAKLFEAMNINGKSDDEIKTAFLSIFTKEAIIEKGSEKIFLSLCEKYGVKPESGAYFID